MSFTFVLSNYVGDFLRDPLLFQNIIRAIQYCVIIRPEIAYAIYPSTNFCINPRWVVTKRILRYEL